MITLNSDQILMIRIALATRIEFLEPLVVGPPGHPLIPGLLEQLAAARSAYRAIRIMDLQMMPGGRTDEEAAAIIDRHDAEDARQEVAP